MQPNKFKKYGFSKDLNLKFYKKIFVNLNIIKIKLVNIKTKNGVKN